MKLWREKTDLAKSREKDDSSCRSHRPSWLLRPVFYAFRNSMVLFQETVLYCPCSIRRCAYVLARRTSTTRDRKVAGIFLVDQMGSQSPEGALRILRYQAYKEAYKSTMNNNKTQVRMDNDEMGFRRKLSSGTKYGDP